MARHLAGSMLAGAALLAAGFVLYGRDGVAPSGASEGASIEAPDERGGAERPLEETTGDAAVVAPRASGRADERAVLATLGWGKGRGQLGQPSAGEGHGETPLRLAAMNDELLLLDGENERIVRLVGDGGVGDAIRLPVQDPKDVGIAKDGTILLLSGEGENGKVTLVGPDGKTRGRLSVPRDLADVSRGVLVSGNDVYVEALDGELRRVGDTNGQFDGDAGVPPGIPTKDGRGYLGARISDAEGAVHVFVVDRESHEQRFSRLLRARLFVEGIFLVDTDAAGTIYIGVSGPMLGGNPEEHLAELVCLDGERGDVLGAVELGVRVGKEAIVDAKALEGGGVVLSIATAQGLRVERRDCT
jgi:hypothetical protein